VTPSQAAKANNFFFSTPQGNRKKKQAIMNTPRPATMPSDVHEDIELIEEDEIDSMADLIVYEQSPHDGDTDRGDSLDYDPGSDLKEGDPGWSDEFRKVHGHSPLPALNFHSSDPSSNDFYDQQ